MTQLEAARKGQITAEMRRVAEKENVTPEFIRDEISAGLSWGFAGGVSRLLESRHADRRESGARPYHR